MSLGSFTTLHPHFLFCFTLLRPLRTVLRHRYSDAPLLARVANRAHTRTTRVGAPNSISVSFFFSPLPSLEAPLLIANMPITVIYKRVRAYTHVAFFRSRFPRNWRIVRSSPRSRFLLSNPVSLFSPSPYRAFLSHRMIHRVCANKKNRGVKNLLLLLFLSSTSSNIFFSIRYWVKNVRAKIYARKFLQLVCYLDFLFISFPSFLVSSRFNRVVIYNRQKKKNTI